MATLKISDLSVGDWVRWKVYDKTYDICISQITDILVRGVHDGIEYGMKITQMSPIPITAEILEKNGFEKVAIGNIYRHESDIEITLYGDGWWHTISLDEYSLHKINGVHQLQHLLRLFGVDKEINL